MTYSELINSKRRVFLDGGTGTILQKSGALKPGMKTDILSITNPDAIYNLHKSYVDAGSDIILANTFGSSPHKLFGTGYTTEQIVEASVAIAKKAAGDKALVAVDMGSLGEMLEPAGTMPFESAVAEFARIVKAGEKAGADLVFIETISDLYELKAALIAAKENSSLPVFTSMSFEAGGRTFTGCLPESYAVTAYSLGADAIGMNCSLGPKDIFPIAEKLCSVLPDDFKVFVKPNSGLPHADGSGYDIGPEEFVEEMKEYKKLNLFAVGGCCGTEPETIRLLKKEFSGPLENRSNKCEKSFLCSPTVLVDVSGITVVGERINPTGKKRFQQAVRDNDMNYILQQALSQIESGAEVLDVNVGVPGTDEVENLAKTVKALQSVVDVPLQLDSTNPLALEKALRVYNGRPIVNSVNGEKASLEKILPLCKKYGAAVVGLALDEGGIPKKAEARFNIAEKIVAAATEVGIKNRDVYIDCLTLTVSAQQEDAAETLEALWLCKQKLGVRTILGVSNISFGLPCRPFLNTAFLTMAMTKGLDLAIMNPASEEMMAAVYSFRVLTNQDKQSLKYIDRYSEYVAPSKQAAPSAQQAASSPASKDSALPEGADPALANAVEKGLKDEAASAVKVLLQTKTPLEIIDGTLIPALDAVGIRYEKGKLFLPQLLQAASSAQSAFEVLKEEIARTGGAQESKGKIVLATVKGDVHDIGKNIVRVILENYGFSVIDLGRDVPPETVVDAVKKEGIKLCGLSALMTTTLPAMAETIALLGKECPDCKTIVGGAVLTPDYAEKIGATYYSKNAKESADIARKVFGC